MLASHEEKEAFNFSSKLKLTTKAMFDHVFTRGKKISANKFAIFFCSNDLQFPRLGIIVSKKNAKTSVARNKFKRVARESFRINQHNVLGFDIVVLAYKEINRLSKKELRECLEKQLKKLSTFLK